MQNAWILSLLLLFGACQKENTSTPPTISPVTCARLGHVFEVKAAVAQKFWPAFNQKRLFGPLVYFTNTQTLAVQATKDFQQRFAHRSVPCSSLPMQEILLLDTLPDTTRFFMNVSYASKDSNRYSYQDNLALFSDVEKTSRTIPGVGDTDEWLTMVIHELFHQFQGQQNKHLQQRQDLLEETIGRGIFYLILDSLPAYRDWVIEENHLLQEVLDTKDPLKQRKILSTFFKKQDLRHQWVKRYFDVEITEYEDLLSRTEGTARYIEYLTKQVLSQRKPNMDLQRVDSFYLAHKFKGYSLEKDTWMFDADDYQYYYALGFSLNRVLVHLNIPYQQTIFKENRTFRSYLEKW